MGRIYPDRKITRDELAQTLFMLTDLRDCPTTKNIKDLDKCTNQRIVQLVVDNGLLDLKANYFKPDDTVTGEEVVKALNLF